jgi:hypothetical protein
MREYEDAITKPLPKNITATAKGEPVGDAMPLCLDIRIPLFYRAL